jgi:hypothetical protein
MPRPATLLLLPFVMLASAAGVSAAPLDIPAALDSFPKATSREYELYGPTVEEVRKANDEIRVAISQFVLYMGEQPRRLAFVLFRSPAEAAHLDAKPFTRRNLPLAPWVLPASPAGTGASGSGAGGYPLGHDAGHRFLVAYVEHGLAVAAATAAGGSGDVAAGVGASAPPGAHATLPNLPDWLEEAVAALCERPALQRGRIDFMRAHLDARIPFPELMTMARPAAGGAKGGKPAAGGVDRATIFCDESLALARFIAHHEEERFFGTLIEGVLRGRTASDVLNTSQSLMSRPEALETQWLEWMQGAERTP